MPNIDKYTDRLQEVQVCMASHDIFCMVSLQLGGAPFATASTMVACSRTTARMTIDTRKMAFPDILESFPFFMLLLSFCLFKTATEVVSEARENRLPFISPS